MKAKSSMLKNWDALLVGVATFIIVAIILAFRPGYTPIEVSDEVLNPPGATADAIEAEASEEEVLDIETDESDTATAEATDAVE